MIPNLNAEPGPGLIPMAAAVWRAILAGNDGTNYTVQWFYPGGDPADLNAWVIECSPDGGATWNYETSEPAGIDTNLFSIAFYSGQWLRIYGVDIFAVPVTDYGEPMYFEPI